MIITLNQQPAMKKKVHLFAAILLILLSCTSAHRTTDLKRHFEIRFGHTGGFTNETLEFMIRENREVFKIQNGEEVKINRITSEKMKEIRDFIDSVHFEKFTSEKPGNINYFIRVQDPEYENRVQWTHIEEDSPLNRLYKLLLTTLINKS